jgi:hypothetical protein
MARQNTAGHRQNKPASRPKQAPLPTEPFDGEINPGDRVVIRMPVNRGRPFPVGGEVEHVGPEYVILHKLSICTDPTVRLEVLRRRVVVNKGQAKRRHRDKVVQQGPTNVWIITNRKLVDKLHKSLAEGRA